MALTYDLETDLRYLQGIEKGEQIGIQKGEQIGIQKGEQKAREQATIAVRAFHDAGFETEEIARRLELDIDFVKKVISNS